MALSAGSVERWRGLPMGELRERVWQLVVAKLGADHAVWTAIRRDPVLAARVRGALTGLAAAAAGTRDEAMRRMWIAAARVALEGPVATVSGPVPDAPAEPDPVRRPVHDTQDQRTPPAPPASTPSTAPVVPPLPAVTAAQPVEPAHSSPVPAAPVPPLVFRAP